MNKFESADTDTVDVSILDDPDFRQLLAVRSRLRWILTALLIVAYLTWALAGIYASEAFAAKFMGSSISRGIVVGYFIIALSIALSLIYVRVVNRLHLSHREKRSVNSGS
jgi:uncharacterized membrane protein (DUF485 family)